MDKVYEKTRYQNIYRHSKNKNYLISISKPQKTSISKIEGNKIYDIEVAKKIRDKYSLKILKIAKEQTSLFFKDLWESYINYCQNVTKLSYNTIKKKKSIYNCYLKELDHIKVTNFTKESISEFINDLPTTNKQKNTTLVILKGFFTYCLDKEIIDKSPTNRINSIKINKTEMKYWNEKQFKRFFKFISSQNTPTSNLIKILVIIEFNLGCRIGEARALTWQDIDKENLKIKIYSSINYDTSSGNYLKITKNYQSQRIIDVSQKLIDILDEYKDYLLSLYGSVNNLILYNYKHNKPYTDTTLRKHFYKYCDMADVPRIRLYDLRHTYVAMMMSEGWELYHISKRIGHKNFSTTVDKYGHIEEKTRKEIAKTTDKYY